jgi:GNAT superfamily N-acetyltransferase
MATIDDDAGLRRLLRETPLRGSLTVTLEREPSFFSFATDTVVALINGRVIACGSRAVCKSYCGGNLIPSAYLADLRVHPEFRKHGGRILVEGYRLLAETAIERPAAITWSAVFASNRAAMRALARPRRAIPEYIDCGGLSSPMWWCGPANRWPAGCQRAEEADRDALAAFLHHHFLRCALAPVVHANDLPIEDFVIIREAGKLIGAVAVIDARATKQVRVIDAPWPLRLMHVPANWLAPWLTLPRLPRRGGLLALGHIGFLAVENDDVSTTRRLLLGARALAAERGLSLLCGCFHEEDPRLAATKGLPATRVDGRLFQVMLNGPSEPWTDSIPHIESAWL